MKAKKKLTVPRGKKPLEILLKEMNFAYRKSLWWRRRAIEYAKAAARYIDPKLLRKR